MSEKERERADTVGDCQRVHRRLQHQPRPVGIAAIEKLRRLAERDRIGRQGQVKRANANLADEGFQQDTSGRVVCVEHHPLDHERDVMNLGEVLRSCVDHRHADGRREQRGRGVSAGQHVDLAGRALDRFDRGVVLPLGDGLQRPEGFFDGRHRVAVEAGFGPLLDIAAMSVDLPLRLFPHLRAGICCRLRFGRLCRDGHCEPSFHLV